MTNRRILINVKPFPCSNHKLTENSKFGISMGTHLMIMRSSTKKAILMFIAGDVFTITDSTVCHMAQWKR